MWGILLRIIVKPEDEGNWNETSQASGLAWYFLLLLLEYFTFYVKNAIYLIFPLIFIWYGLYIHVYQNAYLYTYIKPYLMAQRKRPQGIFSGQLIFWSEKSADCFSMVMCYDIIFQ